MNSSVERGFGLLLCGVWLGWGGGAPVARAESGRLLSFVAPASVAPGDAFLVQTVVQNTGALPWVPVPALNQPSYQISLSAMSWRPTFAYQRISMYTVDPGVTDTQLTALEPEYLPTQSGSYSMKLETRCWPQGAASAGVLMANVPQTIRFTVSPNAPLTVMTRAAVNGAVVPAGAVPCPKGGNCVLLAVPNSGYTVDAWASGDTALQMSGTVLNMVNVQKSTPVTVYFRPQVPVYSAHDFDGDGKADLGAYSPLESKWYVLTSASNLVLTLTFGIASGYYLVPGDYDGDGKTDFGLCTPGDGMWRVQTMAGPYLTQPWGWNATLPVPGDYDGDGKSDYAVFHPVTAYWYILRSSDLQVVSGPFGWAGVRPVPADYDGDGKTDLAVFYPPLGNWYILSSQTGAMRQSNWGWSDVLPVPADYDGDGKTDLAVYYPALGTWYVYQSSNGQIVTQNWGWNGATPLPADYDGDGRADRAVLEPGSGTWYILRSSDSAAIQKNWGWNLTVPVP